MCVIDSKPVFCQKCRRIGKIVVNEISTCTECPEENGEYKHFLCPELQETVLPPLQGTCEICDPNHGIPWGDWK
ncbi:hypothetical protein PG994_004837 [Apiospora phragmitis]|uniref:Uncharacterized protein n=1 Tax=Apiospora phragmitis TaxID=2905665 RepID=A0ABR1VVR3_9PEZI